MTLARFPWMIVLCVAILFPCAADAQVKQDVIEKIKAALPKTAPAVPKKPRKVEWAAASLPWPWCSC